MRKVKDAKDLGSNELIYFKGHAKATYMSDGTTVEDAINNIDIEGGSGAQVQSDWDETDTDNLAYIKNKPNITRRYLNIQGYSGEFLTPLDTELSEPLAGISMDGLEGVLISAGGLTFLPEFSDVRGVWKIHNNGDGTKFLSDDGTYKEVYTKSEIDTKLGDINTILESIING